MLTNALKAFPTAAVTDHLPDGLSPHQSANPFQICPRRQLHFFEGRYKRMVEQALLGQHTFGFLTNEDVGTLAHIDNWQVFRPLSSRL